MPLAATGNVHAGPAAAVLELVEEPVGAAEPAAISKDFIDLEFNLGRAATMLPTDELFADGKLLPLRPPQASAGKTAAAEVLQEQERERGWRDMALVAEIQPLAQGVAGAPQRSSQRFLAHRRGWRTWRRR
ncbi:unnamed protein product [Urochloa humidicola]